MLCQFDITNNNGSEGAQIFVVLPGESTPPSGLVELTTSIIFVALQPLSPDAKNIKSKTPSCVYSWSIGKEISVSISEPSPQSTSYDEIHESDGDWLIALTNKLPPLQFSNEGEFNKSKNKSSGFFKIFTT